MNAEDDIFDCDCGFPTWRLLVPVCGILVVLNLLVAYLHLRSGCSSRPFRRDKHLGGRVVGRTCTLVVLLDTLNQNVSVVPLRWRGYVHMRCCRGFWRNEFVGVPSGKTRVTLKSPPSQGVFSFPGTPHSHDLRSRPPNSFFRGLA